MAPVRHFHYQPVSSPIHAMDVRLKLLSLALLSFVCLKASLFSLGVLTGLLILVFLKASLPPAWFFPGRKFMFVLVSLIITVRAFTTPGRQIYPAVPITVEGLYQGILISWRLVLLLHFGSLLAATTRVGRFQDAVEWALRPLPLIPERRVATMIGLVVRFIPLVLDEAEETALAQKARCVENRRNPVSRLLTLGLSLMRRVFGRADDVTMALQARCYTEDSDTSLENRTCFRIDWKDWIRFAAVGVVCVGLVVSGI